MPARIGENGMKWSTVLQLEMHIVLRDKINKTYQSLVADSFTNLRLMQFAKYFDRISGSCHTFTFTLSSLIRRRATIDAEQMGIDKTQKISEPSCWSPAVQRKNNLKLQSSAQKARNAYLQALRINVSGYGFRIQFIRSMESMLWMERASVFGGQSLSPELAAGGSCCIPSTASS